jgi:hypothetical protein
MTDADNRRSLPQLRSGPLIVGGVLAGAGAMLTVAGIAVGSAHLFAATRQWISEMDVPPSEVGRAGDPDMQHREILGRPGPPGITRPE